MARLKPYTIEKAEIVATASDGYGIVKTDGKVTFIPYAVPGDIADVLINRKKRKLFFGEITQMHEPSPDRTEPRCEHFGLCGGCKWQMMTYAKQLRIKQQQVTDAMERVGKVEAKEKRDILGVVEPWFYRNKLEFSFSAKPWLTREQIASGEVFDEPALGFHVPGVFEKVFTVKKCHLQREIVNDIRNAVHAFGTENDIPFYDIKAHTGFLRQLMFRTSEATGELMVVLVVGKNEPKTIEKVFKHLEANFDEHISSYVWIHSDKLNSSFSDLPYTTWKGPAYITEKLDDYAFHISPTSFFQTNPKQAHVLYSVVRDWMKEFLPEGQEQWNTVYDLYSGTGSIGIFVSKLAKKLVGIEYVQSSVDDAHRNVALNGLEGKFSFYAGDMKKLLDDALVAKEGRPELIIADPARAGMDPAVIDQLLKIAPDHIIYVSCKPATQARDIALLETQYELMRIQPVDMFPHTAHVENVAWLKRIDN
ncbi:MAG: 23S rRNA (uracil(1939)-C(5))-methyltransferase RlmD [Bacteroidia bacterium]